MVRSKKELAIFLSQLHVFEHPNIQLEQYPSDSNVAAEVLWAAVHNDDIEGKKIIDVGCGTGILGIGALLLGASHVEFIDFDASVYVTLKKNLSLLNDTYEIDLEGKWSFTNTNVANCSRGLASQKEDSVVIMNPPFGTKTKHADKKFLQFATQIASSIYTMHKTSTKGFVETFSKDEGFDILWEQDCSFLIKNTMKMHKKKNERVQVTLFLLHKNIQ